MRCPSSKATPTRLRCPESRGGAEPRPAEQSGDLSLAEWPREVARRPLTIPQGSLEVILPLSSNLSSGSVGEPIFSNPGLYYGVTPRLMVGLRHFLGVCLGGADSGCPRVYNDASLDAAWSPYRSGGVEVGVGGALNAGFGDDTTLGGELRAYGKLARGRLALVGAPQLSFGLNNRDRPTTTGGMQSVTDCLPPGRYTATVHYRYSPAAGGVVDVDYPVTLDVTP